MSRLSRVVEDLGDILLIGGKLVISYIRDFWSTLALLWKDDHLTPPSSDWENDEMWNGGVTNKQGSRIDDTNEDNTLVYDEYTIDGNIIYDGMMGEFNDDNG
tara:strand:- start:126 stop:431 length:306 start_codon:yes stop_codon:yes gene_type:complete